LRTHPTLRVPALANRLPALGADTLKKDRLDSHAHIAAAFAALRAPALFRGPPERYAQNTPARRLFAAEPPYLPA
jgi:hypothetical protein